MSGIFTMIYVPVIGVLSGVLASALIGLLDLIEYRFFNEEVFHKHNFPDIVPDLKPGNWAAFASGYRAGHFLLLPSRALLALLGCAPVTMFVFSLLSCLFCVGLMVADRFLKFSWSIYAYHILFYAVGLVTEIALFCTVIF